MFNSGNKTKLFLLFLLGYCVYILGLAIFISGLISSSPNKLQPVSMQSIVDTCSNNTSDDICWFEKRLCPEPLPKHYERVVIMIIDAFRADFIPSIKYNSKFKLSMPFTEVLLNRGSAVSFVTRGFAPTVTLPRIKSLLTGTVSNFLDILLNFNAAELQDDNILLQASKNGLKSVFYGDDTWLKLFPDLFIRSEGTHSFFVSDFKEVDLNVSRHIKDEMIKNDWNILILHFLGVDHIGHSYGPFSEYLSVKLIEMDKIIKFMHEKLKSAYHSPSLIIICGDHGMTSSGSHGGITEEELLTPLIFIDTSNEGINLKQSKTVDQVDFAPTLSSLLGIKIPVNNFGLIIPEVLQYTGFTPEMILCAEYYNFLQISHVYKHFFTFDTNLLYLSEKVIENHYKLLHGNKSFTQNSSDYINLLKTYEELLTNLKKNLLDISTGYNDDSMIRGLIVMWISLQFLAYILFGLNLKKTKIMKILVDKKCHFILLVLSVLCLCFNCLLTITIIFTVSLFFMYIVSFLILSSSIENSSRFNGNFCIIFLFIHIMSLFSSSYIEEEHQTWYFFKCSLVILTCFQRINFYLKMYLTSHSNIWKEICSTMYSTILILILHRIFRQWNQVGNKWQHLPDISDWLNQKENVIYLRILLVLSQLTIMYCFRKKLNILCFFIFSSGLLGILLQKLSFNGSFLFFNDYTIAMLIPWSVYTFSVLIILLVIIQAYNSTLPSYEIKRNFIIHLLASWILIVEIIGRVHNVPLIAVVIIQEHLVKKILWRKNCSITFNALCYVILGMASFFYYGNSNSLSTIDVVTGYTGIQSYRPFIIAFLLTCNTYSTLIIWFTLIPYRILHMSNLEIDSENLTEKLKYTFLTLLFYKLFVLSVYGIVMYLMRHHLFIYSVFFPKLFYEISHVILTSVICLLVAFTSSRPL